MTRHARLAPPAPSPVRVVDLDVAEPLPTLDTANGRYQEAAGIIRVHEMPVAYVELALGEGGLDPDDLARTIWAKVAPAVRAHLRCDGQAAPDTLSADGLPSTAELPSCA